MKIAVFSDIHGNYIAFQRCLEYALSQNIKYFFFLGDYLGECPYPERTMKMLYELNEKYHCFFVRGNKEEYWLTYHKSGETGWKDYDSTTGSLLYTYSHLSEKDMAFFSCMPISRTITFSDMPAITICHGSPYKVNEKLLTNKERTLKIIYSMDSSLLLCGHTHIQDCFLYKDKCIANPGSIGVPFQSNGNTQFMILHGENGDWKNEFISLKYDTEKVIKDLYVENLDKHAPSWCYVTEQLLRKGDVSHGTVLAKAMNLCQENTGKCNWPDIPESFWKEAIKELIPA